MVKRVCSRIFHEEPQRLSKLHSKYNIVLFYRLFIIWSKEILATMWWSHFKLSVGLRDIQLVELTSSPRVLLSNY